MNWLDFTIIALVALITMTAFRRGFIRETVGLAAVVLGVIVAGLFHDNVAEGIDSLVGVDTWTRIASFLAIFLAISIAGWILSRLLRTAAELLFLGWADHAAGGIFGLIKAVIVVQAITIIFVLQPALGVEGAIDDSLIGSFFLDTTPVVRALLPGEFDTALHDFFA
jgi:membrane protein required for colicin V production